MPGPYNDHGFNQTAYDGLMAIKRQFGAEVAYTENVKQSDQVAKIRGYAAQGYTLVIGHGFEFSDSIKQVAPGFPKTWFVVSSSTVSQAPNVASLNVDTYAQGYLAGAIMALLSKKGVIGCVGGMSIPPITRAMAGCKAGATAVRPNVKVLTAMTGSFDDIAKAKEFAEAMVQKGADVLMGDADQSGLGVIQTAKEHNLLDIGMNSDEHAVAPGTVVVSVQQDYPAGFVALVKKLQAGTLQPKPFIAGVADGVTFLSAWYGNVPDSVKQKAAELAAQFKAGKIPEPK
jgi:basic membrane protein A